MMSSDGTAMTLKKLLGEVEGLQAYAQTTAQAQTELVLKKQA